MKSHTDLEHYEVISRSVGGYDGLSLPKEMYWLPWQGDRHITLRPEGQLIVRSYVENKLFAPGTKAK